MDESKIIMGWKVITGGRNSALMLGKGVMRHYEKNVWVHRSNHLPPLFAFSGYDRAGRFSSCFPNTIVVKAELVPSKQKVNPVLSLAYSQFSDCLMIRYNLTKLHLRIGSIPSETIQCQAIRCLE